MRTLLPSASNANAIASCEPIESPSGRAWEVIRNRRRLVISSQIRSIASAALSARGSLLVVFDVWVIVSCHKIVEVGIGGAFCLDVEHDLLDPILAFDAVVVRELQHRYVLEPQPAADVAAQERCGAAESTRGFLARLVVADGGVEHARLLQVRADLDARDRQKADAGIVNLTRDHDR